MYRDLLIFPAGQKQRRFHHQDVRDLIAASTDAYPVDPILFRREQEGRHHVIRYPDIGADGGVAAPPPVTFGGGLGYLRVRGIGKEGAQAVLKNAPFIGSAISDYFDGDLYTFKFAEGPCYIEPSRPLIYACPMLLMVNRPSVMARLAGSERKLTLESVDASVRKVMINSVLAQARYLDTQDGGNRESVIGTDDMLGLRVLEGSPLMVKVKHGVHFAAVRDLVFSINLDLKGPWYAGARRSQGYGQLFRRGGQ